jgi:membrane protein DedA with SNARE-associated domain
VCSSVTARPASWACLPGRHDQLDLGVEVAGRRRYDLWPRSMVQPSLTHADKLMLIRLAALEARRPKERSPPPSPRRPAKTRREARHKPREVTMELAEYLILFVLVVSTGAGIPGPGDAAMIAAGTLAGEGRLNIGVVLVTSLVGWMLGSLVGYEVGLRGGRALLDHPGRLEDRRRKLLAKGDEAFGRHTFTASVTLPAYVSGIFRVRLIVFMLGALVSGSFFIALYEGLSYLFGEEVARRIGDAGAKALLGVLLAVAVGLGLRAGWSRWRARRERPTGGSAVREGHASPVAPPGGDGGER